MSDVRSFKLVLRKDLLLIHLITIIKRISEGAVQEFMIDCLT